MEEDEETAYLRQCSDWAVRREVQMWTYDRTHVFTALFMSCEGRTVFRYPQQTFRVDGGIDLTAELKG